LRGAFALAALHTTVNAALNSAVDADALPVKPDAVLSVDRSIRGELPAQSVDPRGRMLPNRIGASRRQPMQFAWRVLRGNERDLLSGGHDPTTWRRLLRSRWGERRVRIAVALAVAGTVRHAPAVAWALGLAFDVGLPVGNATCAGLAMLPSLVASRSERPMRLELSRRLAQPKRLDE
jgi:hypothetical protein